MNEAFWSDYRRLVARLMPPLAPGDGVPESEIAAAEARLGMNLPTLLQEFYALAGKREDINHSFEHLVSVEELELEGGMLVFYEENQDVTFWAVKSDDTAADPAVFRAFNEENLDWEPDSELLSEFLVAMLVLQAVNGGMAYSGIGDANPERVTNASGRLGSDRTPQTLGPQDTHARRSGAVCRRQRRRGGIRRRTNAERLPSCRGSLSGDLELQHAGR